jgi:hypothetical protein
VDTCLNVIFCRRNAEPSYHFGIRWYSIGRQYFSVIRFYSEFLENAVKMTEIKNHQYIELLANQGF